MEEKMKTKSLFASLFALLLFAGNIVAGENYQIDLAHSYVGFGVKHLVISTVKGNFDDFSGTINFDENDMTKSSVDVKIQVGSIDTDNTDRDNHLRSADFFDVENYPEMVFKSDSVTKEDDKYVMHGQLTLHGVTKPIDVHFEFLGKINSPWGQEVIAFDGTASLSRKEYGMTWNKTLEAGGLLVGDEIKIEIHIEAVKK